MSTLSRKRYLMIQDQYTNILNSCSAITVPQLMSVIQQVLQFDPATANYKPEKGLKEKERRHKLKDQGISTYVSSGRKSAKIKRT